MNDDKKQFQCELINSTVSLPKQKVLICLVRMDENQCFVIFKHIILEYIPFDILMSYSSTKKKVLRNIVCGLAAVNLIALAASCSDGLDDDDPFVKSGVVTTSGGNNHGN